MIVKIYGVYPDGTEDTWLLEDESIDVIRQQAWDIKESRGLIDAWSEVLEND